MSKDILLDDNNDLKILNGDFDFGDSEIQEVGLILQSTQGEWKMTPTLGPNMYIFIKSKASKSEIEATVAIHLAIDNKDFKLLKNKINTVINRG